MTAIAESTFVPTMGAELNNPTAANSFGTAIDNLLARLQDTGKQGPTGGAPQLDAPGKDHSAENLSLLLLEIRDQLTQVQLKQSKEDIKSNLDKKQSATKERLDSIMKAIEAMKKKSKSGLFGKVFGWVAASVMLVAAAVATAATGGAAAPLLIAAMFNMTVMALEESGHMEKLQKALADAIGSDIGATLIITGVILAVNIAGGVGAHHMVAKADLTMKALTIGRNAMIAGEAAAAVGAVGQGGAQMASAHYEKEASEATADAMDLAALMKRLQAMLEDETDRLDEVIRQMDDMTVMVMNIVKSADEASARIKIV